MKKVTVLALAVGLLCGAAVAQEDAPEGVVITSEPAVKMMPAKTAVTAFTKASEYAPEGGWGEKDHGKAFEAMIMAGMEMCMKWMQQTGAHPVGPPFSVYFEDPSETKADDLTSKHGFPIEGEFDPVPGVVIEEMPETEVAAIQYAGPYDKSLNAWLALLKFIEDNGYEQSGPPMEIYLKGPKDSEDPANWLTEIASPVVKKEAEESDEGNGEE